MRHSRQVGPGRTRRLGLTLRLLARSRGMAGRPAHQRRDLWRQVPQPQEAVPRYSVNPAGHQGLYVASKGAMHIGLPAAPTDAATTPDCHIIIGVGSVIASSRTKKGAPARKQTRSCARRRYGQRRKEARSPPRLLARSPRTARVDRLDSCLTAFSLTPPAPTAAQNFAKDTVSLNVLGFASWTCNGISRVKGLTCASVAFSTCSRQ